ncbi:MAG: carboxynorspermidine decarboxylase, partial [Bacteroidota bacterium]
MDLPSPRYVLDEKRLLNNLSRINRVQEEAGVKIILALKAFAMWSVFSKLKEVVTSASASSINEVRLCHEEMQVKSHTFCVAYDPSNFAEIADKSSHLTFNSLSQYELFIDKVPEEVLVALRINPGWSDVETALYNPASPTSRLGIYSNDLKQLPPGVSGLHFHVLCESNSYTLEKVLEKFEERFSHLLHQAKWINMGGGHLLTDRNYDLDHLIELLNNFRKKHDVEIILEPGSAFVWQAGDLETEILDIVDNCGVET